MPLSRAILRLLDCLILGLCLMSATHAAEENSDVLLRETFDGESSQSLANALLKNKYISLAKGEGQDGSDAIRVAYIGYEEGSHRVVAHYPLARPVEAVALSYDVCFDKDFQWVKGGKLHGVGPSHPITGGGQRLPEGWSARIMFKEDGKCATYLYDQDLTKKWGRGNPSQEPVFTAGQWHHVVLEVKVNDPGQANGWARILVDGKEVVYSPGIEYRGEGGDETLIQKFLFSTFHGGNTPAWAPVDSNGEPTTVYALFDNIEVKELVVE